MAVRRHPLPVMEYIMALERPSFSLDLQYPHKPGHSSIWSEYGTYRSFAHAMEQAGASQARPSRIVEQRVVWRSIPIRHSRRPTPQTRPTTRPLTHLTTLLKYPHQTS